MTKKLTFSLIAAVAAVAVFCALPLLERPSQAQQFPVFASNAVLTSGTVTNAQTKTFDYVMDVHSQASVGVLVSFALGGGSETGNITTVLQRSLDGSIWETTGQSIATAASGTTTVSTLTKVDTNGAQFLRLHTIANANTNTCTVTVQYGTKIASP